MIKAESEDMKECKYCGLRLHFICFHARKASPDGLSFKCKECSKKYRLENKERYRELRKAWHESHKHDERKKALQYYYDNREYCINRARNWKSKNTDKLVGYIKKNLPQYNARTAIRRAALLKRTPLWLTPSDTSAMSRLYEQCKEMEKETGLKYHVDHILPLQGKRVSGLHVPSNVRILTAKENMTKGNRFNERS